jgi:hypothetical protein
VLPCPRRLERPPHWVPCALPRLCCCPSSYALLRPCHCLPRALPRPSDLIRLFLYAKTPRCRAAAKTPRTKIIQKKSRKIVPIF